MRTQHILAGSGLLLGFLSLMGCGGLYDMLYMDFLQSQNEIAAAEEEWGATNPNFLYALTASEGVLAAEPDSEIDYTLTLGGLIGNVIAFTDRPNRIADHESMADFVAEWDQRGFADDPPNAALVLHEEEEDQDVLVVELRDPVYDEDADTLTFAITVLTDERTGALAEYSDKADAALPAAFETCSLLIDDAPRGRKVLINLDVYNTGDYVYVDQIWRNGAQTADSYWMKTDETTDIGDSVTRFSISKYSVPGSRVTITILENFDICNMPVSTFLNPDAVPAGFSREGTWTAPYTRPLEWY